MIPRALTICLLFLSTVLLRAQPQVDFPVFNPPAGNYPTDPLTVTITTSTVGASIRYTMNGTTPTETVGTLYTGPISLGPASNTVLSAIAYEVGYTDSGVNVGEFNIPPPADPPSFNPPPGPYGSIQNVGISSNSFGLPIRYTTDGSTPTETNGTLYTGPVTINTTTTLQAITYGQGYADSPVTGGLYTITLGPPAATPVFSPAAGVYSGAQTVTISSATSGATIRYTTDGSTPSETNGTVYSGTAVTITATTNLQSVAYETGYADSPVASGLYTITGSSSAGLNILYNFSGSNNGIMGNYFLVQGSDGNFYGTTQSGGSGGDGIVFQLTPAGVLTTLVSFTGPNGASPDAVLVQGSDGNFYGTTQSGGSGGDGTVFKLTSSGGVWSLATLYSFGGTDGANPEAALAQGSDGNFYGTTHDGGSGNKGTVFEVTPAGTLTTLASFSGGNGANPEAALVQGSDGNFYGTTYGGGFHNAGTVFRLTPAGALSTMVSFTSATTGANPEAGLVQGSDGNFYGTTYGGGAGNNGTLFMVTPSGGFVRLGGFGGANGIHPAAALVQGGDGNLYGTTSGGGANNLGTIFMAPLGGAPTTLVSFDSANGSTPEAVLVQGRDGNLYSTTYSGGIFNDGVVFQLIIAPQNPQSIPTLPPWGAAALAMIVFGIGAVFLKRGGPLKSGV